MKTKPHDRRAEKALFGIKTFVILAALLVLPGQAATYYFSTTGNDTTGNG
jgi:hypothetical protein